MLLTQGFSVHPYFELSNKRKIPPIKDQNRNEGNFLKWQRWNKTLCLVLFLPYSARLLIESEAGVVITCDREEIKASVTFARLFWMGKTVPEYSAVERNSMVRPKTPKHQSSNRCPKITPTLIAAGLSFGRQTLVLNQLNGAEVLQKETIFWFGVVSLQETLWHPLLFYLRRSFPRVVSRLEPWGFIGTHNPVVSIIMKIYRKLVKVQVEPRTMRVRIRDWTFQDPRCSAMSYEMTEPRHFFLLGGWYKTEKPMKTQLWNRSSQCFVVQLQTEKQPGRKQWKKKTWDSSEKWGLH